MIYCLRTPPPCFQLHQAPLVDLYAGENPLGGLPSVLGQCTRLHRLGLAACGLKGALAPEVGALTTLA